MLPRPRKPGAGLGQLFPADEAPTLRRATLPTPEGELLCPMCGGARVLKTGQFNASTCPTCAGAGIVSREAFDRYIAEHPLSLAARQLVKTKTSKLE